MGRLIAAVLSAGIFTFMTVRHLPWNVEEMSAAQTAIAVWIVNDIEEAVRRYILPGAVSMETEASFWIRATEKTVPFYEYLSRESGRIHSEDSEKKKEEKQETTINELTWDEIEREIQGYGNDSISENGSLYEFESEILKPGSSAEAESVQTEMTETKYIEGEDVEEESGDNSFHAPKEPVYEIDYEELYDFDTLVRKYYTVDESTSTNASELDVKEFLSKDLSIEKNTDGPQILIYHTHSQEAYADSIPGDESTSVMGMGDRLTELLTEVYGYQVLHHKGKYDVVSRDYAYTDALPEIEKILKENPSIQVVIDLHRDAVPEHTRLVTDVDGRPTARFMFFNGLGRLKNTGNISYLYNENLADNLAMSFQMQMLCESYFPGLARRIYLKGYRYNMHLMPRTMLIELGAQNNTVEEAENACDILAFLLDKVLSGE